MIVRLGFLVAASIAAYAVKQVSVKSPRPPDSSNKNEGILGLFFNSCCMFLAVNFLILCM